MMWFHVWMAPERKDTRFFDDGESVSSFHDVHAIGHKLAMIVLRARSVLTLSTPTSNQPL